MKSKNKKGFTLIELIIAIAIITTVVFIGYKVLNKSEIFSNEQRKINNVQLGFNNLRKYITEDLKKTDSIIEPSKDDMNSNYTYQLTSDRNKIDYMVDYNFKGNKKFYTIKRVDNGKEISFLDNQPARRLLSNQNKYEAPLVIDYNEQEKIYSVQLNYGDLDSEFYTFDVYNGDTKMAGGTDTPNNSSIGGNLIKQCIIQVDMFIQQIYYEARGESFETEISECKKISEYIIDNFQALWNDANVLKNEVNKLKDAFSKLDSKVDNGQSEHKQDIKYYIQLSKHYLDKTTYILNNQNYYDNRPELTKELAKDLSLISTVNNEYHVDLHNIRNNVLEKNVRGQLLKLKIYLNLDGYIEIDSLISKIQKIQENSYGDTYPKEYNSISFINNYCLIPMYHNGNFDEKTIQTLSEEVNKLIGRLEYFRDTEVNELLKENNGSYDYIEKKGGYGSSDHQDISCAINLTKSVQNNITVIIEELRYIIYALGSDIKI